MDWTVVIQYKKYNICLIYILLSIGEGVPRSQAGAGPPSPELDARPLTSLQSWS